MEEILLLRLCPILCIPLLFVSSGCSGTISGRFADTSSIPAASSATLQVAGYAGAVPSSPRAAQNFSNLNQDVQVAALEALAKGDMPISVATIVELLGHPIGPGVQSTAQNLTTFSRRLAFTTDYQLRDINDQPIWAPADRLDNLRLVVNIDAPARFSSWSRMATEHRSVTLAEIERSTSSSLDLEGVLSTISPDLAELTVGPSWRTDQTEAINIEQSVSAFYTHLKGNVATIVQEGERDVDLNGTLIVDVDIEIETCTTDLWEATFRPNLGELSNQINVRRTSIPGSTDDVYASVAASGVVRHVERNAGTYLESDDRVRPIEVASTASDFIVISQENLIIEAYIIYRPVSPDASGNDQVMVLRGSGFSPGRASIDIVLLNENQAYQLLNFVRSAGTVELEQMGVFIEATDRLSLDSIYDLSSQQNPSGVPTLRVSEAFLNDAVVRPILLKCPNSAMGMQSQID